MDLVSNSICHFNMSFDRDREKEKKKVVKPF